MNFILKTIAAAMLTGAIIVGVAARQFGLLKDDSRFDIWDDVDQFEYDRLVEETREVE